MPQRALAPSITRTPAMATQASSKPLGTAPEPFDSKANNAEMFWSNLANYYYLNDGMFSDESRKVSVALTHFKLEPQLEIGPGNALMKH
jgi:hypothetical protein